MFDPAELTNNAFLDGRLTISQPRNGYRAATDPIFLAAAVPAQPGQSVLELGCGAAVALCAVAWRVADCAAHGLEMQADYAALARQNGAQNSLNLTIHDGDLRAMPADVRALSFDHVMANPPFFETPTGTAPRDLGRAQAHQLASGELAVWTGAMLRRLHPRGCLTLIHRTEALGAILTALHGQVGDIRILPLAARHGRAAGRVIVQGRKGARGALQLLAPFVVHDGPEHINDGDDFSAAARLILRHGAPLVL